MFTLGSSKPGWQIVKDLAFMALALLLITRGGFLGIIIGFPALGWYGWNLFLNARILKLQKQLEKQETGSAPAQEEAPQQGKIKITDLSDAKEVDFEKE